ncbi:MAG: CoA transferase [Desulfobacterales bacterium]
MSMALEGIRILDLGRVWSGPLATRVLADLGAEIINIQRIPERGIAALTPELVKMIGVFPDNDPGEKPWNRTSVNNDLARGKLGMTLELDTEEGLDIFKRLVKISHVILENFSPRVMPNLGLDYPVLRKINPAIILCSMPGYGLTGPYRDWVSYGTNLDPAAGLAALMGYPDAGPQMSGNAYPDPLAGINAANAILTALYYSRTTGKGQHIDLSQSESASFVVAETVLGFAMNKKVPPRIGNHHPHRAPHNIYRCKGDDQWVAIACATDDEFGVLCTAMGNASLAEDKRFSDVTHRLAHQDALDNIVGSWTQGFEHHEVMATLQGAGVPSGAVLNAPEIVADPHLNDREFFVEIDHPDAGRHRYCRSPINLSKTPTASNRPAPCLGQHNRYVLGEILGLSQTEMDRLEEKGIIGDEPREGNESQEQT